jgi:S1-C subfamily serine protease
VQTLVGAKAEQIQLKPGEGLLVSATEKNSPAERAQIQSGFLLTTIDGKPASDLVNAANALRSKSAGDRVQLTFLVPRLVNGQLVQLQPATAIVVAR